MERIFLWKTSSSDLIREVAENVPSVGIPEGPPFRKLRERMGHPALRLVGVLVLGELRQARSYFAPTHGQARRNGTPMTRCAYSFFDREIQTTFPSRIPNSAILKSSGAPW